MDKPFTILGISGSLRHASYNRALLITTRDLLPVDVVLDIFDLQGIPLFNQDNEKLPVARVTEFKEKIRASDAILISTPEYNYSIPGVLKNAIDTASRPYGDSAWSGKPVALIGASPGAFGTARAQYHLRQVFISLDMPQVVQPEVMISHADQAFDAKGKLTDANSTKLIGQLVENLVHLSRQLKTG
jgi:chromate reductase